MLDEPSVVAGKISSAGAIGGDNQVGNSSVAIASSAETAVDPLGDALAALDRRDYATAQPLFEACGRKDVAAATEDAWAALDRQEYATAQRLFEALGPKDRGCLGASRARDIGKGFNGGVRLPGSTEAHAIAARPYSVFGYSLCRPLRYSKKAKSRGLRPILLGSGFVFFAICGASVLFMARRLTGCSQPRKAKRSQVLPQLLMFSKRLLRRSRA